MVKDFAANGILITPSLSGLGVAENVLIANSFVLNNAGNGIRIFPLNSSTLVQYAIDHTTVAGNGTNGSDAGILVNSGSGLLNGTLSSVYTQLNNIGVNFIGNTSSTAITTVRSSVFTNNNTDLSNNSNGLVLNLLDANQINGLSNGQTINSDGTNDIVFLSGNTLLPFTRR